MRGYARVLAVVSLLLISALVSSIAVTAAEKPVFVGSWEGTDLSDGSYQQMQIRGGGGDEYMVVLQDSECIGCDEVLRPPCKGIGKGTINGDTLTAVLTVHAMGCPSCPCQGVVTFTFTYIDDDTLEDITGSTWSRVE